MKIIFCIGEELSDREAGNTFSLVQNQLEKGLKNIDEEEMKHIIIAYEPVWAIGTGLTASPEQAQEVHHFIREKLEKMYSSKLANSLPLLYGGSVKSKNINELLSEKDINGALIGGASLKADEFNRILEIAEK